MLSTASADSTLDFQNPMDLGSGTQTVQVTAGSGTVDARLSGILSDNGGLTKTDNGTLELTASNTYTGTTTVSGGILRLSNCGALPGGTGATSTGSNLTLDGGVVELAAGDFTRSLGNGPGQVQFTVNGGGFAAVGANRVVNLGSSATLTWGSGSFLPSGGTLMLGTLSADSTLDFQNPMDLSGGTQTIEVTVGSGTVAVNARLSGTLSGNGGLTITGGGNLELTASNTYTGATTVSGNTILRLSNSGALPGGNLTLDGGLLELAAGDFTPSLGSGPGQVQFTANGGGFSAIGANRVVNLGGSSGTLTWGGSFLPGGAPLMLGTASADSMVDFQNPIVLGSGTQTVQVTAGSGTAAVNARLSGVLSGNGGLMVTGGGNLELTASNTYSGTTTVSGNTILRLSNPGALASGNLTLDGGVLELAAGDFTCSLGSEPGQVQFTANGGGFSAVGANRVVNLGGSSGTLTWGSGGFLPGGGSLILGTTSADSMIDFQNPIVLSSASQTVQVNPGTAPVDAQLSGILSGSGGLTKTGNGTLALTAGNTYTGATTVSGGILRLSNSGALPSGNLTLDGGVIELAATDFTRSPGSGQNQVQFTNNGGGFSAVGANRVVNLGNSATLTWGSGGFLPGGAPLMLGTPSADSTLDFQNPIALVSGMQTVEVTAGSGTATVDAQLSGNLSGSGGLAITGGGTLVLSGSDSYTGGTTVNAATLYVTNANAIADGTSLTIGAGGVFIFDPSLTAAPGETASGEAAPARRLVFPSRERCCFWLWPFGVRRFIAAFRGGRFLSLAFRRFFSQILFPDLSVFHLSVNISYAFFYRRHHARFAHGEPHAQPGLSAADGATAGGTFPGG